MAGNQKDISRLLERAEDDKLPHDIYIGLRDVVFLVRNGYRHLLVPILKNQDQLIIKDAIEGVVLRIQSSKRWERYEGKKSYDVVIAIPKWSRVVILSTTEIVPQELVSKIKIFDKIILENFHFYDHFNKLHGVSGRHVIRNEQDVEERSLNLCKLNFLFRTTDDLKKLSQCKNMKMFTVVPDINAVPRLGFYFITVCKVRQVSDVLRSSGPGIDPRNFKLTVSDDFGSLDVRLHTNNFILSFRNNPLGKEINRLFGSSIDTEPKFNHPEDFEDFDGYMLIVGHWFLGDNIPNVTFICPLNPDVNYLKYQILGYMNTRRKVKFSKIRELWEKQLAGTLEASENLKTDIEKNWGFYKEDFWDENVFRYMMTSCFKLPRFSVLLRLNISKTTLNEWIKHTSTYFRINNFIKDLYMASDPEKTFSDVYSPMLPAKETPDSETLKELGFFIPVPELILKKRWSEIERISSQLKESNYSVYDVFDWDNGGKRLANKWFKASSKSYSNVDEYVSATYFILQARGSVMLPNEFSI